MNICFFSRTNYWQGIKGGMDIHGRILSERMVEKGHCVSIICTRHPDGVDYEKKNGVNIYYLQNTVFGSRRKGWPSESVSKFYELHKDKPFDVILSQSFDAFGITRRDKVNANIPVVLMLQGTIVQELKTFLGTLRTEFRNPRKVILKLAGMFFSYFVAQRPLLSLSDRVVTASSAVANDIYKWYGKKIFQKCVVIFNGVDSSIFNPDSARRMAGRHEFGFKDNDTVLLTLGNLAYEKGHHIAIEAVRVLKERGQDLKLLVVGDGEKRRSLEQLVDRYRLGRNIFFVGEVDNSKTVIYYNCADIFLMTTLRVEGLPFVLLEAMSCGKPVIASRIGGNVDLIKDGENGMMIGPGDIVKLADSIQMLLADQCLFQKLSVAARQYVMDEFSAEQMVDRTLYEINAVVLEQSR